MVASLERQDLTTSAKRAGGLRRRAKQGLDGQPMAIMLVEQYYDFAEELADAYVVMERGEVVMRGRGNAMAAEGVKARLAI